MKKITYLLLLPLIALMLASCGDKETTKLNNTSSKATTLKSYSVNDKETTKRDQSVTAKKSTTSTLEKTEDTKLAEYKALALSKLDEIVNPLIAKIKDDELRQAVERFYNTEKTYIEGITDEETAKDVADKVLEDSKAFALNVLKPFIIERLDEIIKPLINKITHIELKAAVEGFYEEEMDKISSIDTLDGLVDIFNEIKDDTINFIEEETEKILIALKNKALEVLDPYVLALINKIPYQELKDDVEGFYTNEKKKLDAVDSFDGFDPCVEEIKEDLEVFALSETKKIAIGKLQEAIDAGLAKIPNQALKADLEEFSDTEIAKLNAVSKVEDVPSVLEDVLEETAIHIKELLASIVKDYIEKLTRIETATAYDYLPEAMSPTYQANLVDMSSIPTDFTSFVNVSDISKEGFGEQWQMVVENINQSVALAKVFNVCQTAISSATNLVNIYIENSYSESMNYEFSGTGFTGKFEFVNTKLVFSINITTSVNIPVAGSVSPQIKMEYDLANDVKSMYINLGDAYKIKYNISDNEYEMASTYGVTVAGKTGSRASYLSVSKGSSKTTGHIYEYTSFGESDLIKACADFYIENGYVSVVGNKASGMVAFTGYVNELYLESTGALLGFEVREELSLVEYNTLWFNIWDINGINTIKVTELSDGNESKKSTVDTYINGSSTLFSPTYNKKLGVKTSRKYDVELRSRFYYSYDSVNDKYVANEVMIPMFFIQEGENFESFVNDAKTDNNLALNVSLSTTYLNKILADYDTLIDIFIQNKELMSSEAIKDCLKD